MCAHVCHEKGGTGFPGPEELDKAETRGCGKIVIIRSHRPAGRSVPAGLFLNGLPFGPANGKIKEIRTGNNGIACFRKQCRIELKHMEEQRRKSEGETVMVEISKKDWKLYRERLPKWQEHFMERLTREYIELLNGPGNASDRFWKLEERILKDKKNPGVLLRVTKSNAIWDIAVFVGRGIITMDELDGFSQDLIEAVKLILSR